MATYILDAMRYKEGAFMAAWLTMGAANLAAIFSALLLKNDAPVALTLLTFLLNALTLFLAGGCWCGGGAAWDGAAGGRLAALPSMSTELLRPSPLAHMAGFPVPSPASLLRRPVGLAAVPLPAAAVPGRGDRV